MSFKQRRIFLKNYIESQIGYCPLIQPFHSRRVNNRINHLHECSLRIVYKESNSSYVDLLAMDKSFTIHQRTFSLLSQNNLKLKKNFFKCDNMQSLKYKNNLLSQTDFVIDCVNTQLYGLNSLKLFCSKSFGYDSFRNKEILFKNFKLGWALKWALQICFCYLCRPYIQA